MVRLTLTLAFSLLACVYAAPVPRNPKVTLAKDISFGLGVAAAGSKTSGVLENNTSEIGGEVPLPGDTGDDLPDVTLVENVNTGAAVAVGNSISSGVVKGNKFAGVIPFSYNK